MADPQPALGHTIAGDWMQRLTDKQNRCRGFDPQERLALPTEPGISEPQTGGATYVRSAA